MTENTATWPLPAEPVVPLGRDALDALTVGELATIGRAIKYDAVQAVLDPTTGLRPLALAHLAYTWAKRSDHTAKLQPLLEAPLPEVLRLLRMTKAQREADAAVLAAQDTAGPTTSPDVSQ